MVELCAPYRGDKKDMALKDRGKPLSYIMCPLQGQTNRIIPLILYLTNG